MLKRMPWRLSDIFVRSACFSLIAMDPVVRSWCPCSLARVDGAPFCSVSARWFLAAVATPPTDLEAVLSSIRRVKKGPGRRPLSAKRQRFMELRGTRVGASLPRPARSAFPGPPPTIGRAVTRRTAMARSSGFVPALERLAVRQISSRFLSQEERIEIADLWHAGLSLRADRAAAASGAFNRSRVNCARNAAEDRRLSSRSTRTGMRQLGAPAVIARRIETNGELQRLVADAVWTSGGVHSRSAGNLRIQVPRGARDGGCAMKVSTRRSTSRDQR